MIDFVRNVDELVTSMPKVKSEIRETADDVARLAKAIAPRDSGHYADSIEVVDNDDDGARVLTTDIAGHLIEWGSAKNPAYGPLRRACDGVGVDLDEDPHP